MRGDDELTAEQLEAACRQRAESTLAHLRHLPDAERKVCLAMLAHSLGITELQTRGSVAAYLEALNREAP